MSNQSHFSFAIGIPTINRADLLKESLEDLFVNMPEIPTYIVDNGNQDIEVIEGHNSVQIFKNSENKGVSGSWNQLFKEAISRHENLTHLLILNDDIVLGKKESEILDLIHNLGHKTLFTSYFYWSVMVVPVELYLYIGEFDENFFPAYYEDNDYAYRIHLSNGLYTHQNTELLDPAVKRNSMTINKDPYLNSNFGNNLQYYISKWGGHPTTEIYKTPFNK